ncbi:TcmI family type II polyketide cyclase [Nocardiopsis sp. RSe5-2]|uniref:TcmI family type II polyketide cyclase n=1 Tax=Nocardiopsis endophytica TaxID=3018445 RepID=A0ABT4U7Q5_9ACTN|nr:TcmI family type II polyketide cyclase [Nocardiopsis endophytica]MDA2812983.1 TcmI family type II polyketide cyclase [Nocardiopsis endophytica]
MAFRALMVRNMRTADADQVAAAFAEHDRSGFPERLGLRARTLFHYHGLYAHLLEADSDILPAVHGLREDPAFTEVDRRVAEYLTPYDPERPSMLEARAEPFYVWEPGLR